MSMASCWQEVKSLFEALSYLVKDVDPDGIELLFTISPLSTRGTTTTRLVQLLNNKKLEGVTDISHSLGLLLDRYLSGLEESRSKSTFLRNILRRSRSKPLNVYILTNGIWT